MRLLRFAGLFTLGAGFAGAANAHGLGHAVGLVHGLMHPLSGVDHLAAMAAVGLLAVVVGGRALIWLPLSFMTAMLSGFALAVSAVSLPGVEALAMVSGAIIAAFALVLPRLRRSGGAAAAALVAFFGAFHGHAHGAEMMQADHAVAYAAGFLLMTAAIHAGAIAACSTLARRRVVTRLATLRA